MRRSLILIPILLIGLASVGCETQNAKAPATKAADAQTFVDPDVALDDPDDDEKDSSPSQSPQALFVQAQDMAGKGQSGARCRIAEPGIASGAQRFQRLLLSRP